MSSATFTPSLDLVSNQKSAANSISHNKPKLKRIHPFYSRHGGKNERIRYVRVGSSRLQRIGR